MAAKTYRWKTDPGKQHSIPERTHRQHLRAALRDRGSTPQAGNKPKLTPYQKAPIVTGSSITNRQLNRGARGAARVQFGPEMREARKDVGESKAYERDIGGYYDQYLDHLAKQSANVRAIGDAANQQLTGLQAGVTGLSQAGLAGIQQPAAADAAARGTQAADLTPLASNATAIRQAMVGNFAATQAAQNSAASRYDHAYANNVGPGQKLQAQAFAHGRTRQAGDVVRGLKGDIGAFKQDYKTKAKQTESENVTAQQIAGVKAAGDAADRNLAKKKLKADIADKKAGQQLAWAKLDADTKAAAQKSLDAGATPNKYGIPSNVWNGMTTQARQKVIKDFGSGSSGGKNGKGGGLMPDVTRQRHIKNAAWLGQYVDRAFEGKPFDPKHGKGEGHGTFTHLSRSDARAKMIQNLPVESIPVLEAALDRRYNHGTLRPETQRALRAAKYSIKEIARAVGVKTVGEGRRSLIQRNTAASRGSSNLGGSGHL